MQVRVVGGWAAILFGVGLFVYSMYYAVETYSFTQRAQKAQASVREVKQDEYKRVTYRNGRRRTEYHTRYTMTVEFRTGKSQTVRDTLNNGMIGQRYKVGDTLELLYDPEEPEDARVNTFAGLYLNGVFTFIASIVGMVMGWLNPHQNVEEDEASLLRST